MSPPPAPSADARGDRVLVLAPLGRDAQLAEQALRRVGLESRVCRVLDELRQEIAAGAGAVLLTDDALHAEGEADPDAWIGSEPAWSELPLVVLTGGGLGRPLVSLRRLERRRNATFLRRPVSRLTLVSTLRAALESRRRQYAVRDLLLELEAGVRQRDEFLATLGHELRNPTGAVHNAVGLLREELPDASPVARAALGMLDRQIHHLGRILDDLLEISRVTRGKLELRREAVELGHVCRSAVEAARGQLEERRQRLSIDVPREEVWVHADATRLEQILWNLLSNASKYSDVEGRIALTLAAADGEAEVRLRDDGRGMTPDFLPRAFDLFAQAESGGGGLGLGLPLSRRLAEMHGGTLRASSEGLGKGSELTLRLP